jgi:hypothetical protein
MNKNLINSLAKLAKVKDVEAFTSALQSETDTDFTLDTGNLIVRTSEEELVYKTNISKEVKDKAFSDAFEIQIKNMKKATGLEFEGKKSDDFILAYKSEILKNANILPDKRIQELETTLEQVNASLSDKDIEFNNLKSGYSLEKNRFKAESYIPELPQAIGLSKSEATDLFFLKNEIKEDGIYKDGVRQINTTTAEPITLENAVSGFVSERGWNVTPSGRGGGSGGSASTAPSISTFDQFESLAKEKGLNVGSQQYNALLADTVKANPELVV